MKEKREFSILENADNNTVELLSEVPVLTDEEKKRMLAMSKKKLDNMNRENNISMTNEETAVSGVEAYNRPKWYSFVSAAACFILVGGIVGTIFALSRNDNDIINNDNKTVEVQTTTDTSATTTLSVTTNKTISVTTIPATTESLNTVTELTEELVKIADKGIRDFFYIDDILSGFSVKIDENDKIIHEVFSKYADDYRERTFRRVIDSRFDSIDDMKALAADYLTDPLITDLFAHSFDIIPIFIEKDGKLYTFETMYLPATVKFISDPVITAYNGTTFYTTATINIGRVSGDITMHFQFVYVDGKWKVSSYEVEDDGDDDNAYNDNGNDTENGSETEGDLPNVDLANDILKDLRELESLRAGGGAEIEEDIYETIVTVEGFEYNYYKVSDDFASENFKNSLEDIKYWVDSVVTGEAYEELYKYIYAEDDANAYYTMFREIDGELYYFYGASEIMFRWFGEPQIKNVQNGSFDIFVKCYCNDDMIQNLTVNVVKDGYCWKINKCELENSFRPATEEERIEYENTTY